MIWSAGFDKRLADWALIGAGWGRQNRIFMSDDAHSSGVMRVSIPRGSIDPGTMLRRLQREGGTGFRARLPGQFSVAQLRYAVRFPADFEAARGGKLPGLCGGSCNGGGKIPNGRDGFSTRYMWREELQATVYAYLPTSVEYGTSLRQSRISFTRGKWIELIQEIELNTPGNSNGRLRAWVDGQLLVNLDNVNFRSSAALLIDGIYFDVFFGGNDDTWAAPKNTYVEFAAFEVRGR